jgi:hypothetical protein
VYIDCCSVYLYIAFRPIDTTTVNVHTIGALSYVDIDTTTVNVHTIGALSYVNIDNTTVNVHTIGLKAMIVHLLCGH